MAMPRGYKHTEESKAQIRTTLLETIARRKEEGNPVHRSGGGGSHHRVGIKHTEETKAKMKAWYAQQRELGIGKSAETREKMSAAKRGVPKTAEHKAAMSAAHRKRHEDKRNGLI